MDSCEEAETAGQTRVRVTKDGLWVRAGIKSRRVDIGTGVADNGFRTRCTVQKVDMTNRLDVRLNSEHRRRLEELAREKEVAISDVVRCMIDTAYEDILCKRRKQAVERLIGLNLEDPPDPETVSRELEAAHEPGGLH